jgi:hypothetical protein
VYLFPKTNFREKNVKIGLHSLPKLTPPVAALAGDDLDFVSGMPYSSSDNPYTALEHTSNENSFVNGMNRNLMIYNLC